MEGSEGITLSSLLGGRLKSPVAGWGWEKAEVEVEGLEASERERDLDLGE